MSWTSIVAVVASGLVVTSPILSDPRAVVLAELCTTDLAQAGDAETVSAARIFIGTGQVVAADSGKRLLTINHRDIRGLMPPMTMMFRVKSGDLVEHLRPNDEIRFKMTGNNSTIVAVVPLQRAE